MGEQNIAAQAALMAAWRQGVEAAKGAIRAHRFKCNAFPVGRSRGVPMLTPRDYKDQADEALAALQPPADLAAQAAQAPGDAVAQEREACAKIAEAVMRAADEGCRENRFSGYTHSEAAAAQAAEEIVNDIRARAGA